MNIKLREIVVKNPDHPSKLAVKPSQHNFLFLLRFDNGTEWVATLEDLHRIQEILDVNHVLNLKYDSLEKEQEVKQ